jgi:hypothetical protein
MNYAKSIGILIIGAILGYGFSFIGKANNAEVFIENEIITSKTASPITTPDFIETAAKVEQEVIVKKQPSTINSQHKTTIIDANELNQEHLDLVQAHQALKEQYHKSLSKISSLQNQLSELDGSDATDEQMEELVPEPFKSFLSAFRGKTRNDIYDFHNEEDDLDWGYDTQNSISDFVQTHYEGTNVEVISVICKQPRCEILVTEKQEDAWENIMKDMSQQSWWTFLSFSTSTRSNAENELSIYIFLSQ